MNFLAMDFETANYSADSACSIGLVKVVGGTIEQKEVRLIRPPSSWFAFTHIHGLTWKDVKDAPTFGNLWPEIEPMFEGVDFIAAHNAGFDRGVLNACCARYEIIPPSLTYRCSMVTARRAWNLRPTKLSDVCRFLNIELNHHEALSDALACARIMLAAELPGWRTEALK